MTPDVVSVRQNLGLIVDGGAPVPVLATADGTWGNTKNRLQYTWRSGPDALMLHAGRDRRQVSAGRWTVRCG